MPAPVDRMAREGRLRSNSVLAPRASWRRPAVDGQTWQVQQLPRGVLVVLDITCPNDTSCYAVAIQTPPSGSPASFVLLA